MQIFRLSFCTATSLLLQEFTETFTSAFARPLSTLFRVSSGSQLLTGYYFVYSRTSSSTTSTFEFFSSGLISLRGRSSQIFRCEKCALIVLPFPMISNAILPVTTLVAVKGPSYCSPSFLSSDLSTVTIFLFTLASTE